MNLASDGTEPNSTAQTEVMAQERTRPPDGAAVLFSAAAPYLATAAADLRRWFPDAPVEPIGPDVGRIEGPDIGTARLAAACGTAPMPFVRHLARETVRLPPSAVVDVPAAAVDVVRSDREPLGAGVALQVWTSGGAGVKAEAVRAEVASALAAAGVATARGGRAHVLGACITPAGISLGVTPAAEALADWPGGRVILGRPAGQVTRAEWKLEELFKVFDVPWPAWSGRALDLGASPGGWARVLRERGFEVWAVDPGALHPRVAADPGVHHIATTAGRFLRRQNAPDPPGTEEDDAGLFDVIVNDMRMIAERSCRVMVDGARRLVPNGIVIMTLKVSRPRASDTVNRSLTILQRRFEPLFVRQLFHNKHEVTVVARRM